MIAATDDRRKRGDFLAGSWVPRVAMLRLPAAGGGRAGWRILHLPLFRTSCSSAISPDLILTCRRTASLVVCALRAPETMRSIHRLPVLTQLGRIKSQLTAWRRVDRGRSQGGDRIHGPATLADFGDRAVGVVDGFRDARTGLGSESSAGGTHAHCRSACSGTLPDELKLPAVPAMSDPDELEPRQGARPEPKKRTAAKPDLPGRTRAPGAGSCSRRRPPLEATGRRVQQTAVDEYVVKAQGPAPAPAAAQPGARAADPPAGLAGAGFLASDGGSTANRQTVGRRHGRRARPRQHEPEPGGDAQADRPQYRRRPMRSMSMSRTSFPRACNTSPASPR